jgi:hypothetical protein
VVDLKTDLHVAATISARVLVAPPRPLACGGPMVLDGVLVTALLRAPSFLPTHKGLPASVAETRLSRKGNYLAAHQDAEMSLKR